MKTSVYSLVLYHLTHDWQGCRAAARRSTVATATIATIASRTLGTHNKQVQKPHTVLRPAPLSSFESLDASESLGRRVLPMVGFEGSATRNSRSPSGRP